MTVEFRIDRPQTWTLDVYDAAGRRVTTVERREGHVGDARVEWDGRGGEGRRLPNGVYFLRLEGEDFVASKKVTLLR